MSERQPQSNPRLENFDSNKALHEQAAFENELYGNSGETAFSDQDKQRVIEGDAYERHLRAMSERPNVSDSAEHYDSLDYVENTHLSDIQSEAIATNEEMKAKTEARAVNEQAEIDARMENLVQNSPHVRQMIMIAKDINTISQSTFNSDNEAALSAALKDKEDRLQELLLKFGDSDEFDKADIQEMSDRIIDMTSTDESSEVVSSDEDEEPEQGAEISKSAEVVQTEPEPEADASDEGHDTSEEQVDEISEPSSEVEQARMDINEEFNKVVVDVAELGEKRQAEYEQEVGSSDRARADRELLALEAKKKTPGKEVAKIEPTSTELVRVEPEEEPKISQSWAQKLMHKLSPTRAYVGAKKAALKKIDQYKDMDESEKKKAKVKAGLAGAALVGTGIVVTAVLLNKNGGGSTGGSGNFINDFLNEMKDMKVPEGPTGAGVATLAATWADFDSSARDVTGGEGWYSTFQQMGISEARRPELLNTVGPELQKIGDAYRDSGTNEWRISKSGPLSNEALQVITSGMDKLSIKR